MSNGRINDLIIIRPLSQQIRSVQQNLKPLPRYHKTKQTRKLKTGHPPKTKNRTKRYKMSTTTTATKP